MTSKIKKKLYFEAAKAFSLYKEEDRNFNSENYILYGLCYYFEKIHNINLIELKEKSDGFPELDLFWSFTEDSKFDGNMEACNKEGAGLRVLIMLFCYNMS